MNYALITYDGRHINFDEQFLPLVEKNMAAKTAFKLRGEMIQGSDIRRVERVRAEGANFGSELRSSAYSLFQLPAGEESTGFWQAVTKINKEHYKARDGKPWIYAAAIDFARRNTSLTTPEDLTDFIYAEYASIEEINRPEIKADHELIQETRDFYATEEGQKYLSKIRALTWN